MVTINYISKTDKYKSDIKNLLIKYDDEFIPSLSSRHSTIQTKDLDISKNNSIKSYLKDIINQELIIAKYNDKLIGFLSFRQIEQYNTLKEYSPCIYVSTTIVEKSYRKNHIAKDMNKYMFKNIIPNRNITYITRRTWSTNIASINYIESMGFKIVKKVKDDRGKNIHTLYYAKEIK